jgi:hypothetical protein
MPTNQMILLASRPTREPSVANFQLVERPVPELVEGQALVRHHYLSLDPYMRGRMGDAKSYAAPQPVGEVMLGGTVGEIVATRSPRYQVGDQVVGMGGWQLYQVVDGSKPGMLRKVDASVIPLSAYLGAVGMPGVTAWYGLTRIIAPKAGETVVVSAASGAVGSVVGQLAKLRGARAIGIAGGTAKCRYVTDELGFDACLDYRELADASAVAAALKGVCPNGIDGAFENVGGKILDAVLLRANAFCRIALCGMIAGYNGAPIPIETPQLILINRVKIQGFIVSDHMEDWPAALAELGSLVAEKKLRYRESIVEGLEAAPEALIGLFAGRNFGKQLVKLN